MNGISLFVSWVLGCIVFWIIYVATAKILHSPIKKKDLIIPPIGAGIVLFFTWLVCIIFQKFMIIL
jgi:hypothetical protein